MEFLSVDPEGIAGGLLCIWDPDIFQLSGSCCNRRFILLSGTLYNSFHCVLLNIYAPNDVSSRSSFWNTLLNLKVYFFNPWCMGGDFNEIRHMGERVGCFRRDRGMQQLNEFIDTSELNDLPLLGRKYTWCNAQESQNWSRIDRVLLSPEWLIHFKLKLWGLPRLISDHCPLLMMEDERDWGPKPFRFINAWTLHPKFAKLFTTYWVNASCVGWAGFILQQKLKHLKLELKKWNTEVFENVSIKLKPSEDELHDLDITAEERELLHSKKARRREVRGEVWKLYRRVEWLWHQQSRLNWSLKGDTNTRFFQVIASSLQSRNMINSISVNGVSFEEPSKVKHEVLRLPLKFLGLPLGANPGSKSTWKPVLDTIRARLSGWMRKMFSFAGRLTLIKSVLSCLPVYYLSLFKMPDGVAREVEKIEAAFLWGENGLKIKIHLVKWLDVTKSVAQGGLGIRRIRDVNVCLLLKWWWKFGNQTNALWRRIICSKYKIEVHCWHPPVNFSYKHSRVWKDILFIGDHSSIIVNFFLVNCQIKVGDGSRIRFWYDKWCGVTCLKDEFPFLFNLSADKKGSFQQYFARKTSYSDWNFNYRRSLYARELSDETRLLSLLASTPTLSPGCIDSLVWNSATAGSELKLQITYTTLASLAPIPPPLASSATLLLNLPIMLCFIALSLGSFSLLCHLTGGFNGASHTLEQTYLTGGWHRNECVFTNAHPNSMDLWELIKVRLAYWLKASIKDFPFSVSDMLVCFALSGRICFGLFGLVVVQWCVPWLGWCLASILEYLSGVSYGWLVWLVWYLSGVGVMLVSSSADLLCRAGLLGGCSDATLVFSLFSFRWSLSNLGVLANDRVSFVVPT
ncbi:hypothetical protein ACSBR2_042363 [Camellia fascicularis]